jgi:hypothetical protein
MLLKEKMILIEFIIFAKNNINNIAENPTDTFIDKVVEIYHRKKNVEFKNPLANEFPRAPNTLEYWLHRGWNEKEAEKKRCEKILASSCSLQALIAKHGEEKGYHLFTEINTKKSNTLDGFIRRHGDEIGKKLYAAYTLKMSTQNTLVGMIETYGEIEGNERYNTMISGKIHNLESVIKRYGEEEGKKRYTASNLKRSKSHSYVGFVERFGSYADQKWEELSKNRSYRTTVDYYIEKYGDDLGRKKHTDWFKSSIGGDFSQSFSKTSKMLFESLKNNEFAQFGCNEALIELTTDEQSVLNRKFIRPDFLLDNKIIEFYGTYWHCHESMFAADQIHPQFNKTATDIRNYDCKKNEVLKLKGFDVLVIWEHNYYANKEGIIAQCNDFLNQ